MFIVFALIATLPLMALSYLALAETRGALSTEVGRTHENTAKAAAAFVGAFVENGRGFVGSLATRGSLVQAAEAHNAENAQAELAAFRARSTYEGTSVFGSVALLDGTGRVIAADPPGSAHRGDDLSGTDTYLAAMRSASAVVLPVPVTPGPPTLPIATLVPNANGTAVGVLVAQVSLARLGAELQAFALGPSEGILVTDDHGRLLVHHDPALLNVTTDWSNVQPVRLALRGPSGHLEFNDALTEDSALAGYASVPRLGWAVVDEIPTAQAYAALTRLTAVLIVLSGILVGAILLASVVLARRIVKPVRELTTAAGALSSGQLTTRIKVKGGDEIAELGAAFNEMASRIRESLDGLRASEARYRNLVESANDFILTIEPDGTVGFAGPLAERVLMRDRGDLQGRAVSSLVHAADRPRFDDAVKMVLDRGEPVSWVLHGVIARDGTTRLLRSTMSPVFGKEGKVQRVLVVASDITSERRQERFRESSFQMARLVSEESTVEALAERGLAVVLAAGPFPRGALYTKAGPVLRETATAALDGALGGPWDHPTAHRLAEQAVATGATVRERAMVAVPLLERGEALGALVVQSTERQSEDALPTMASQLAVGIRRSLFEARLKDYASELETRVEERTAELHAKNEEMEQFLYSVSHDLKAPLISIEGYAEALEDEYKTVLHGEAKLYLERIRKNATLMESLILDILELSRIGRIRDNVETIDLDKLVADVGARFEERFRQAGGRLDVVPLPALRGEKDRIEQLLNNLVENGIKYRHPDRAPIVRVEGERSAQGTTLRVIDNGRGIPPSSEDQLFKIFQRLPTPEGLTDPGGTGMGLAIVKRIVETHGGTITASSVLGEGTVFTIFLPTEPPRNTTPPPRPERQR